MRDYFVGPMPVKEFFRKLLPTQKLSEEDRAALPGFEAIANPKKGDATYEEFVRRFSTLFTSRFQLFFLRSWL